MAKLGRRAKSMTVTTEKHGGKTRPLNREEKDSKARYEQLRRRRRCVAKKAQELQKLCHMKVFVQVTDQTEQRTDYFSTEQLSDTWPFPWQRLVGNSICLKFLSDSLCSTATRCRRPPNHIGRKGRKTTCTRIQGRKRRGHNTTHTCFSVADNVSNRGQMFSSRRSREVSSLSMGKNDISPHLVQILDHYRLTAAVNEACEISHVG